MKILIIGATGFIGNAIFQRLLFKNYNVVGGVRNPDIFGSSAIEIDFMTLDKDKDKNKELVQKIIHISALGSQNGTTPYHTSKNEADIYLRDLGIPYNAQKLYASLYLISPLLRLIIGFVWIWSGIVSAFLYPQPLALELLHEIGISTSFDILVLYGASFLDIILGICIILSFKIRALLLFSFVVIIGYTLILTLLAPYHWLHPFGAILKNLPLLVSIYILIQMEKYR